MLKEWFHRALGHGSRDDSAGQKLESYLADGNACAILRLIMENPGITASSLAGRAHINEDAAAAFLKMLVADGLVVVEKENARDGYHIAGPAKAAVAERLPLNYQCPGMLRE